MSPERFDHLLGLVENSITKEDINIRKAISAEESLAVTLRFLTIVIICVSHREINPESRYQANL